MKDLFIAALVGMKCPVKLQGTFLENEPYPDRFITFFITDSAAAAEFDNQTAATAWGFEVANYSNSPDVVEKDAAEIRKLLKAAGFIPQGKGRDLPSDQPTHTGWVCGYYFIENEGVL